MSSKFPKAQGVIVRRVGSGPAHHFFGYYNKSNFSLDDSRLLANRVEMKTKDLDGTEVAKVGYFDLADGDAFHELGETTTWNWQMGCQLQWVGKTNQVIFNTRATGIGGAENIFPDFRSTILDVASGARRELPLPIYVLSPDGQFALTVNYSRFLVTHRTIGYCATHEEPHLGLAPEDDGIFRMDIHTGQARMLLSLADLTRFEHRPSMDKAIHWITHMEFNPTGNRIVFIHRWTERVIDETCFLHRLFTMNSDGTDLHLLEDSDHPLPQLAKDFDPNAVGTFDFEKNIYQISHPMWKSDTEAICWGPHNHEAHYHLYQDRSSRVEVIGRGVLIENGHMTYSKSGRWILSDTYPDDQTNERALFLFDTQSGERYDLGSFYTPPDLGKHNRCDLHPRWSRSGTQICIDSVHEGPREIYLLDLAEFFARHGK